MVNLATFKRHYAISPSRMTLVGEALRQKREELGLTLRDVEDRISLSNAYLSQLETGKISQPSPTVLRKLSDFYEMSYARLMELAGHPAVTIKGQKSVFFRTSSGLQEVTKDEEKELIEYLRFIRSRRPTK